MNHVEPHIFEAVLQHPKMHHLKYLGNYLLAHSINMQQIALILAISDINFSDVPPSINKRPYCLAMSKNDYAILNVFLQDKRISIRGILTDMIYSNATAKTLRHVLSNYRVHRQVTKHTTINLHLREVTGWYLY